MNTSRGTRFASTSSAFRRPSITTSRRDAPPARSNPTAYSAHVGGGQTGEARGVGHVSDDGRDAAYRQLGRPLGRASERRNRRAGFEPAVGDDGFRDSRSRESERSSLSFEPRGERDAFAHKRIDDGGEIARQRRIAFRHLPHHREPAVAELDLHVR